MGKAFTAEQDAWLRMHHAPNKIILQLTEEYNAFWGENRCYGTMKRHCKNLGLIQAYKQPFTEQQDAWLRENSRFMDYKETAEKFNDLFSASRSPEVIKNRCGKLGVGFKNDHLWTRAKIGTEKIRNGFVWVKVSDIPCKGTGKTSTSVNWRQKSHIVWEQHYGSMPPDDYVIVFLDRNTQNFDINNLYAINKKTLREMAKNSWWKTDPEFTLAAIKWCELHFALKNFNGSDRNGY